MGTRARGSASRWRKPETIARDSSLGRAIVSPLRRTWALCTFLDRVQKRSEFQIPATIIGDSKCPAAVGLEFRIELWDPARDRRCFGITWDRESDPPLESCSSYPPMVDQSLPLNLGQLFFNAEANPFLRQAWSFNVRADW